MRKTNTIYDAPDRPAGSLPYLWAVLACLLILSAAVGCARAANPAGGPTEDTPGAPAADTSVGAGTGSGSPEAEASILVTEVDLDALLSQGLPVILNFGDDSRESLDTLAALESLQEELSAYVLIRSVDLAQNPDGGEGFPVPTLPTQFFYTADGQPIALAVNIGVLISVYLSVDTEEPVFAAHEGPLSVEDFLRVLQFMGVVTLEWETP